MFVAVSIAVRYSSEKEMLSLVMQKAVKLHISVR